jgi:hypothetical protein
MCFQERCYQLVGRPLPSPVSRPGHSRWNCEKLGIISWVIPRNPSSLISTPQALHPWNRPIIEDDPGPLLIYTVRRVVSGLALRASENQKKSLKMVNSSRIFQKNHTWIVIHLGEQLLRLREWESQNSSCLNYLLLSLSHLRGPKNL